MLVRPDEVDVSRWPWIPLLTGMVLAATVRTTSSVEAALKWPNDVIVEDRKLAGILVERHDPAGHRPAAVIGIGLNVTLRADELPVPTATSLALEGATNTDRTVLVRALLRNLARAYDSWRQVGGDPARGLHAAYTSACTTIGRQVRVELAGGGTATGVAEAIDDHGRLLVRTRDAVQALGAGDVVHLRPLA